MKLFLHFCFIITFCSSMVCAQQTGVVDYTYLGIKFTIPEGWKGQEMEESFLIGSDTRPGFVVLVPHEARSISELEQQAQSGISEEGVYLNLESDLNRFGAEGTGGEFSGFIDGAQAKAYIIGVINPFGYGVMVMAATDVPNYSEKYRKLAEEIASSLSFRTPEEPEKNKEWKEWISGAKLVYMNSSYDSGPSYGGYSTYSSYSSRREVLLCSGQRFSYYTSSSSSFDSGGGFGSTSGSDNGQGEWDVIWDGEGSSILSLSFSDGRKFEYTLTYEGSKTMLQGSRYFVIHDHGECN